MSTSMALPQLAYDCDSCGACCRALIIEATHLDAIREPRIQSEARLLDMHGKLPIDESEWGLNAHREGEKGFPCVFLASNNKCSIYSTRPNVCVSAQAGSSTCQRAREMMKLAPLEPRKSDGSVADRMHAYLREYTA